MNEKRDDVGELVNEETNGKKRRKNHIVPNPKHLLI